LAQKSKTEQTAGLERLRIQQHRHQRRQRDHYRNLDNQDQQRVFQRVKKSGSLNSRDQFASGANLQGFTRVTCSEIINELMIGQTQKAKKINR
jgi:hypothetical protein